MGLMQAAVETYDMLEKRYAGDGKNKNPPAPGGLFN